MNVSALAARPIAYNSRSAGTPPAETPAEPQEERAGSAVGRGAAALGGAVLGFAGSQAAGLGNKLVGSLMTEWTLGCLPKMGLADGTAGLVNNVFGLSVGVSSLVAAGAGVLAGATVAYHAAAGAERVDDALRVADFQGENAKRGAVANYMAELQDYGADLRSSLSALKGAGSYGSAAKSGFDAGSSLGAPIGAAAGKIQGFGWGIALGTLASLPIVAALPPALSTPIMIGGALLGAGLGAKAGEPIGAFTGGLVGGATGALLGTGYHGVRSLTGHGA